MKIASTICDVDDCASRWYDGAKAVSYMAHAGGRPQKLDELGDPLYDIDKMCEKIDAYTDSFIGQEKKFPILKDCTFANGWDYDYVITLQRKHDKLKRSIKRLLALKEVALESLGSTGAIDKTMAIFSLKQLGWRDKVDIEVSKPKDDVADELDKCFKKRNAGTDSEVSAE